MSASSAFRHQRYTAEPPAAPYHLLAPGPYPEVDSHQFRARMGQVGAVLRLSGVRTVYLVHGTFVGPDAWGILAGLGRVFPSAGRRLAGAVKQIVDVVAGEAGNYTPQYARGLEDSMHAPAERRIAVKRFHWSSENHHVGRADAAVRLIDELASGGFRPGDRVLLWGHSHAGNVFALVTNLLGGDRKKVRRFFAAARVYYRWPAIGAVDIPVWKRVAELLEADTQPLRGVALDMVTFGTPIRYAWDPGGYAGLLHFVNHRPVDGLPEYRAAFPPKLDDILAAAGGDYIQQLGIAGTNVVPSIVSWRTRQANRRLARLLQPGMRRRDALARFQAGAVVHDAGTTLLVDYGRPPGNITHHLAGHAVYTRREWMLFHTEEVAARLYGMR